MCLKKYFVFQFSLFCLLQLSIGVEINPSQQLPTELFKPIKSNSGAANTDSTELEVDNTRSGGVPTNRSPQTFNDRQQTFTRPNTRVDPGLNAPAFRQDQNSNRPDFRQVQGFIGPEIIRHNNYIEAGHPQQIFDIPGINQNDFMQRTYTVPSAQNQPPYTVTSYQSPTYRHSWSWSSDGSRMENFSSDGPNPSRIPNGFGMNDISLEDNLGNGFNNMPLGQTYSQRSGYHTVRTTGPDGRTREKTVVW